MPGGQKGRGRTRGGAPWLGLTLAGANNSKRHQPLSLGDQEGDRGEARFHREDPGGGS